MNTNRVITILSKELGEAHVCYDHLERSLAGNERVEIWTSEKKSAIRPISHVFLS